MGLNLAHLKYQVIEPALATIGLMTIAALNLVTGTALAESAASDLLQTNGPALGLWQMEPATEQDIWTNFLAFNPTIAARVQSVLAPHPTTPQLVWNLAYGAAMCRLKYWRSPEALATYNDATGLATNWKMIYNTSLGAGAVDANHVALFQQAIGT